MIVLDTNVVSELLRPTPDEQVLSFVAENRELLAITVISIHEVTYGLARLPQGRRRRDLTASFTEFTQSLGNRRVLDLTAAGARRSAHVRATRGSAGRPMDILDSQIAGITLEAEFSLATRNIKDFESLGLDLIDPWIDLDR